MKITKSLIIKEVAKNIDLPENQITAVINEFLSEISGNLSEGIQVSIDKFGIFYIGGGTESNRFDPNEKIVKMVKTAKTARFSSAAALKKMLNQ